MGVSIGSSTDQEWGMSCIPISFHFSPLAPATRVPHSELRWNGLRGRQWDPIPQSANPYPPTPPRLGIGVLGSSMGSAPPEQLYYRVRKWVCPLHCIPLNTPDLSALTWSVPFATFALKHTQWTRWMESKCATSATTVTRPPNGLLPRHPEA